MKCACRIAMSAVLAALLAQGYVVAQQTKTCTATQPAPRADKWWTERQATMNARIKQGNVDLLFIGDSITQGWEGNGKDVWAEFYGKRNAANLGIGGDRTEHVLWRLDNGNLDGIKPKLAIVMIGTNNTGNAPNDPPEHTADGVKAIIAKLRAKLPETKVLLLAVFPRGANSQDHLRQVNDKVNAILVKLADDKMVCCQDLGKKFVEADGTLSREIMPDLLHLSPKGYRIWAEAIEPTVAKVVGAK